MSANYLRVTGQARNGRPVSRTFAFDDSDAGETTDARVRAKDYLEDLDEHGRRVSIWASCRRWGLADVPEIGWQSAERPAAGL